MRLVRYLSALVICMALLADASLAMDSRQLADTMPRQYSGTFAWRASPDQKQRGEPPLPSWVLAGEVLQARRSTCCGLSYL